jgi:hypothetical protein
MSATTELVTVGAALERPATAAEIRAQVNLIQEVMQAVMKDGVHFGTIPGTPKPTLYKPGSEKILSTFRIAIDPVVEDLSTADEARFRVQARATSQASGVFLGSGVGECSSSEEKYRWRGAVCEQEWDEAAEDRRRAVWKRGRTGSPPYQIKQVRTHPADVANTILKMAKKRAQIDVCLTVTAASDVFAQDIEDLPEELRETVADEANGKPAPQPPQRKSEASASPPADPAPTAAPAPAAASALPVSNGHAPTSTNGDVISDKQAKRFYAIAMQAGWNEAELKAWLKTQIGTDDDRQIPRRQYDRLCSLVASGGDRS